jgi:hypothetical protein
MPRSTPDGTPTRALADVLDETDDDISTGAADTWATAIVGRLADRGWHITREPADHLAAVPPGHDAVMVRMDFDAELDTLAACVKLLDAGHAGEMLDTDERARIVAYLAERYEPGVDIAVEYRATTTEGA